MRVIGVIGCGVVGGAVAKCFASAHRKVLIYDRFKDIGTMAEVAAYTDMAFVSVPTPTNDEGSQDLSPLLDVLERLSKMKYRGPVIVKCTVVPGTMDMLASMYPELVLVHNPEFLREASPFDDFMSQAEILMSSPNMHALDQVREVFKTALPKACVLMFKDYRTTEMAKYIHNCTLAVTVALANEWYKYSKQNGINYADALMGAKGQGVVGRHMNVPGPDGRLGFGGMCFPKDTFALLHTAPEILTILRASVISNNLTRGLDVGNADA